ncbi:TonB-linked SusC/RagA family outer membrane protein [Pedobacter sp. UYP30]|uniref:SusC/RagA family TonB-linked outer membrane protein n=1 Tax=Pedobacter sp. UYP30 TaxID=1756400 RepID=UPI003390EF0F
MKRLLQSLFVLLFVAGSAMAQDRTVTGKVVSNEDNLPIPGVSVRVLNTKIGAVTNANGMYSIQVPASENSLTFSFIGYVPQTLEVAGKASLNVSLLSDAKQLTEVVVTALGVTREKRSLGYSAPSIKSDELKEGESPSVLNSLAGKVAGVNITGTSNTPGSSSRIVLRGGSSISGSNQALIVIDGIPIDNSSVIGGVSSLASVDFGNRGNDVDPNDVASVTVLKGPAAAALYGSRASNGALIITTKTGSQGKSKTEITFNSANTFSSILKLPDFQNEYGQGYNNASKNNPPDYFNDPQENWSWGFPFTGKPQEWGQKIDGVRLTKPYSAVKNNIRDFFETGFASNNNLSISGGGEKTSFYLALNSLNSDGIYPTAKDTYNKYGVRFNGTAKLSNKFDAGVSFNYSKINSNQVGGGQGNFSVYDNVLQTPRDIPLTQLSDLNNKFYGYGFVDANGVKRDDLYGYYGAYTQNPYWVLKNYDNFDNVDRVTGNFNVGYKPLEWLNITERLGVDSYTDRRRILAPKYSYLAADEAGNYTNNPVTSNGSYEIDQYNVNEIVHDLIITATHKFNEDFQGSLLVGNNIRQRFTNSNLTGTNSSGGLVVPDYYNLANSNGPVDVISDFLSKRRLIGIYADLSLSYKSILFLDATARNDWSSTLPVANNSFFYPSVSGSFVFSELLKNSSASNVINYGKIRASFAQVGSDTDPYRLLSSYTKGTIDANFGSTVFPFGNVAALMAGSTIGNANLKPEQTSSFEVGTELGLFKDRVSVDFTYYRNNSKNQILSIPIPNSTGYGFSVINAGEVQNRGVELSLKGTPVKTSYGLTWDVYGTFTKNNNKVVSLLDGVDQISLGGFSGMGVVAAKGRPYGEFYGVANAKDGQGRTIVSKTSGLPVASSKAEYLGSYNPDYQASLGTTVKFKNWSLNALFDTKQGGVFYSRTKDITAFNGTSAETGGERIAVFPNSVYLDADGNSVVNTDITYNKQDYYPNLYPGENIVDASYIKLRNLGITYDFSKSLLSKTPFGAASLGLFGNNLFLWTPKSNKYADPEVNSAGAGNVQGFDYTAQPSVRNYGFNLKVSF